MGATYSDFFTNMMLSPGLAIQLKPALGGYSFGSNADRVILKDRKKAVI